LPSSTHSATRKKNPAIVLYQANEFIESCCDIRLSFLIVRVVMGDDTGYGDRLAARLELTRADFTSSSPLRSPQLGDRSLQILHN
jgi:hypothetical protein